MLTIQLNGGLGNQIFQYALGKSLANRFDIRYDTSHLAHASTARSCELMLFQTQGDFGLYPRTTEQRILSERKRYHTITDKLHFPVTRYIHRNLDIQDKMYIKGFWQSYKYFDHLRDTLLQELQPATPLDQQSIGLINQMKQCNAVAVHIRRGDFQQKKLSTLHLRGLHRHTIVPLSYYQRAIIYLRTLVSDPHFFVFSNDIAGCREQFVGDDYTFVDHNTGIHSYKDLVLMSHAAHNIICNSTFSRRGAYLNQTPGQIVLCPKQRYDVNISVDDLLLPHRIRL